LRPDFNAFPVLKQNICCHLFKGHLQLYAAVTRWLVTQENNWERHPKKGLFV